MISATGWLCPKCGAGCAPWAANCQRCAGDSAPLGVPNPTPIVWPANGTGRGPLRDDFTITYATSPGTRPVEWIP